MYIVSMDGDILAEFNPWDIKSVAKAEAWIKHHRYYLWKFENVSGTIYLTVRSY